MTASFPDPRLLSRRALILTAAGGLLAACSSYVPEGATRPASLSRSTIMARINGVRRANGRPELSYSSRLARAANDHVRLMASRGRLSHELGGTLRQRVTRVGYFGAVGENLAGGQDTLEGAIEGWLDSPSHRNTLLSPNFTEFGLAATNGGGAYDTYWAIILGGDPAAWLS